MEMVKAKINGRYEIILPKARADRPEWYQPEGWERARLESMHGEINSEKVMGKTPIVFYVGAEEGEMPALLQMWGAKTVLFEPNPKVWSHIRAIYEANKLEMPLGIFTGFASDISQEASLPTDFKEALEIATDGWPNCSKEEMIAAHGFAELDKEADSFDQIKLDHYVEKTGIIPTAISLDVEGSEGLVLRGAENILLTHRPKIWLSGHPEFLYNSFKNRAGFEYLRNLRDWLKTDFGYKEQILDYQHEVHLFYQP